MSSKSEKTIINTVDEDGKKLHLTIKMPGHKVLQEAQMVYNVELTSLIKQSVSGNKQLFSKQQLERHLNELGVWTEVDAKRFLQLQIELRESELKLKQGGIPVSEAKIIALTMKAKRAVLLVLYGQRSQFDAITMEAIADNHKFKFLLTKCIVVEETNVPLFTSINDYETKQNEKSAIDAATTLAGLIYGYDENTEAKLVENQWLEQFEFADNKGRLVDDNKRLIDSEGKLINEDGRFVDEKGSLVDNIGRPIDEDGNFVVKKTKPFTDDNGNPITKTTKKRKSVKSKVKK
ncbi:hypothetical protein LCGC14_0141560 [marine sediment metagenome]|uniref:Uncharacterized protein n=1 Tax=marine sediment metagenome TaxID=412755 RepID=A0A0F9XIA5_9ZZZZ